jgi:hypothetical protein
LSFGGYGLSRIDITKLRDVVGYTFVMTSDLTATRRDDVPASVTRMLLPPSVELLDEQALYAAGYRYEDLVAAVDIVVTKPGYGIIAECVANNSAILYTSRGHFPEYDVLVREMPRWLRCGFISNEDLLAGRWQEALDQLRDQPAAPERIGTDGAERAVDQILKYCS